MPYHEIKSGKNKGKYKVDAGEMKGKTISKEQMQAIEIAKHAGEPGATKPKKKGK